MNGIVIGEQCHYCTKFRSPLEIIHQPGGVKICVHCEHRHAEALDALATGRFTGECSECGLSADELRAQKRCGPQGEMAVHFENGRYRAMCLVCDATYVPKRRELYGQTEFGKKRELN
jgi:hypothetical protein